MCPNIALKQNQRWHIAEFNKRRLSNYLIHALPYTSGMESLGP